MGIPDTIRASQSLAITPHDTNLLSPIIEGIWVGTGGNINLEFEHDSTPQIWLNIPGGSFIQGRIKRVFATSTTAGNLIGVR